VGAQQHAQSEPSEERDPVLTFFRGEGVNHGPPGLQWNEGARFVLVRNGDVAKWNVSDWAFEMVRARRGSRIPSPGLRAF
jgi:hypothetical protein